MGARSFTESSVVKISVESASSASFARQSGPLTRISFMVQGGFGPGQIDGMSMSACPKSRPIEIESILEYVTNFICCFPLLLLFRFGKAIVAKNNLNLEQKKILMWNEN